MYASHSIDEDDAKEENTAMEGRSEFFRHPPDDHSLPGGMFEGVPRKKESSSGGRKEKSEPIQKERRWMNEVTHHVLDDKYQLPPDIRVEDIHAERN